jgi:hypothetical protein
MQDTLTAFPGLSNQQAVQLRQTYENRCSLFFAQPLPVKQFFIVQSQILDGTFLKDEPFVHFQLPERVICEAGASTPLPVPENQRNQKAGGRVNRLKREPFQAVLSEHLAKLEKSPDRAVSAAACLTRFTLVLYMVQGMLPAKRNQATGFPLVTKKEQPLFQDGEIEKGRNNQPTLENSLQRSATILASAANFAPYILADEGYQLQCISILGELVKQGQGIAIRQTHEIIARLKAKAAAHELDRGLSLSLPYFDDGKMDLSLYDFEVIPTGRIPFDPRCVIMATRAERTKVANAIRFSRLTCTHLLSELSMLEAAFEEYGYPAALVFNEG